MLKKCYNYFDLIGQAKSENQPSFLILFDKDLDLQLGLVEIDDCQIYLILVKLLTRDCGNNINAK